ncbi:MAG: cytochrome-c oxidase, cbb3-type subunit III [Alphaproteobacteria bacterium]|jgi:cytochrome c oxidase cbb3-type subunit 3|nr:cytochrome-c oxidase, cbb3-type subunit III [Alphaproteobacteria bacterium]
MAKRNEIDKATGTETTGHEWDGIKELNTPLPRWWLWVFYATIVWAVGYWVLYPAWPMVTGYTQGVLNHSQRADVAQAVTEMKTQRAVQGKQLQGATLQQIEADPNLLQFAREAGKSAFGDNCATCHGSGAQGFKGYPNLNDDIWLWGGTLDDIRHTIQVGVRSAHPEARVSQMPAYGRDALLEKNQIGDLTQYVLKLSGQKANAAAAARAEPVFKEQCAACHGDDGRGKREFGSPNLTDREWLYGGSADEIRTQIEQGRGGVMPTWGTRLDAMTVDALAVYVHSLGGGE